MNSIKTMITSQLAFRRKGWLFANTLVMSCLFIAVHFSTQAHAQKNLDEMAADLILSDQAVVDWVLATNEKTILGEAGPKTLEFKKKSLKQRLERSRNLVAQWSMRAEKEEQKAQELRKSANAIGAEIVKKGQTADRRTSPVAASQSINEQLLAAALLEYQKTSWDVAAEQALIKSKLDSVKPPPQLVNGEEHIAELEVQRLIKLLDQAELQVEISNELWAKGSRGRLEVQADKNDLERAQIEVRIAEAKLRLIPIRQSALESKVVADASEQLVQLEARKKKMEELIDLLQEVSSSCLQREELLQSAKLHQKRSEAYLERAEIEATRKEEIEYLIQVIEARDSK